MVTVFFDAPQRCVTNLKKLLLQGIVPPETLEHMASTWNHEKSHISPGLKWSRPSGRIRRNKLGYYSGLAVLPNDVVIAWGTGASVGKAKKKKKRQGRRRVGADTRQEWLQLSGDFFCFFWRGSWLVAANAMLSYGFELYSGRHQTGLTDCLSVWLPGPWS